MGAYLSEPVTEKVSIDETSKRLSFGASSMQGWRVAQEDAHSCVLDFDENTSLFAVYDGHGGSEVAQYCASHLHEIIRNSDAYKSGNMGQALEDSFLKMDATLIREDVLEELKVMAGDTGEQSEDGEDNEVDNLYAEANMPLEELLAKYRSNPGVSPNTKFLKREKIDSFLRPKMDDGAGPSCSSSGFIGDGATTSLPTVETTKTATTSTTTTTPTEDEIEKINTEGNSGGDSVVNGMLDDKAATKEPEIKSDKKTEERNLDAGKVGGEEPVDAESGEGLINGATTTVTTPTTTSTSSSAQSKGKSLKSGKRSIMGMKIPRADVVATCSKILSPILRQHGVSPRPMVDDDGSEESDESDDEYEGNNEDDNGEENEDEEEEDEDDENDEEQEDNSEDEEENDTDYVMGEKEEPGFDSGCTAVVALLKNNELYVANAGDSRCVICRSGKAIEMSRDHKPEDELERQRIEKAGGNVTDDGRVNGGLNLSRAIGDHSYKKNETLPPRDQMISAQPDIRTLTIDSDEDEFMVIACDGIWNFMNSQEVVDFVRERLTEGCNKKLSLICEELFDKCLSPTTIGDGTGCDNMTCIIVTFHDLPSQTKCSGAIKRTSEDTNDENSEATHHSKRVKLENDAD